LAAAPRREPLGTKLFRAFILPTAVLVQLFSEGGALHIPSRPSKKKPKQAKAAKKQKKAKKDRKEDKASPKAVDAARAR
jgi:hypothetical protein